MEQLDLESPKSDPTEGPTRCFRSKMTNELLDDVASRTKVSGFLWSAKGNPIMGGSLPTSLGSQPYLLGAKASELKRNGGKSRQS
jgi:hypothetical protein